MKICMTGVTGFVGRHANALLAEHDLYCQVRNFKKWSSLNLRGSALEGDLSDFSWLDNLPKDLDVFVHIASIVHSHDASEFERVNVVPTKKLVDELASRYLNLKFILISSLAAAGPGDRDGRILDETDMPSPVSAYGESKLAQEKALKRCPDNWQTSIIRPPMVIGPGDEAFLDLFKPVANGFKPYIGRDGLEKEYSFVCVFDLVETIKLVVEKDLKQNEIFFSSYPLTITHGQFVNEIERQVGRSGWFLKIPRWLLPIIAKLNKFLYRVLGIDSRLSVDKINEILPMKWTCSSEKSRKLLEQNYLWDLSKTVKITLEYYKENRLL